MLTLRRRVDGEWQRVRIEQAQDTAPSRVETYAAQRQSAAVAHDHEAIGARLGTWLDDQVIAAVDLTVSIGFRSHLQCEEASGLPCATGQSECELYVGG
jgi:hypothetical protein